MSPFWVNAAEMMVKASWWTRWARASSAGRTVQAREVLHASQHGRQKGRGHQARSRAQQEQVANEAEAEGSSMLCRLAGAADRAAGRRGAGAARAAPTRAADPEAPAHLAAPGDAGALTEEADGADGAEPCR